MNANTSLTVAACLAATLMGWNSTSQAALLYDQNVTTNVIYGSGNTNGGWTVDRGMGNIELGLRAKVRYSIPGDAPQNVWNSNGDGSYSHEAGAPAAQPNRARWNFDWSINSDYVNQSDTIDEWQYVLGVDSDTSAGTNFHTFDPTAWPGASFGNNGTAQGGGTEGNNASLASSSNLAQDSLNYAFFEGVLPGFSHDPNADGFYTIYLEAYNGNQLMARTEITVIVGDPQTVPAPGSLLLAGLALLGLSAARRRR